MRITIFGVSLAASTMGPLFAATVYAQALPGSINSPPRGAGTEEAGPRGQVALRPGIEASAGIGSGFADTYVLGVAGRVGYTFEKGIYVGGAVQHYVGHSVGDQQAHATFVGGEVGYKLFPTRALEIRPYAFAGPAIITQVASNPVTTLGKTDFALQPGLIGMYHFGDAFIGADAHVMLFPSPNTVALLAGGGFGF